MFCKYCGRQLITGELCICPEALQARSGDKPKASSQGNQAFQTKPKQMEINWNANPNDFGTQAHHNNYDYTNANFNQTVNNQNLNYNFSENPDSGYVYAELPAKKERKKNIGSIIAISTFILGFLAVLTIGIIVSSSVQPSHEDYSYDYTYEWDYDIYSSKATCDYDSGVFKDGDYANEWANLQFDTPSKYEEGTKKQYRKHEIDNMELDCLALKDDENFIAVYISEDSNFENVYTYDILKNLVDEQTIDICDEYDIDSEDVYSTLSEDFIIETDEGETLYYTYSDLEVETGDSTFYRRIAVHRVEDGVVCIIANSSDSKGLDKIFNRFEPVE